MARQPDSGLYENFLRRDGRLNRWRYFKRITLLAVVETLIAMVVFIMNMNALGQLSSSGETVFKLLLAVGQIPFLCLMIRRLHDCDKDEKLAYVSLALNALTIILTDYKTLAEPSSFENAVTIFAGLIGLYVLLCPGTHGENQYGEDPLE